MRIHARVVIVFSALALAACSSGVNTSRSFGRSAPYEPGSYEPPTPAVKEMVRDDGASRDHERRLDELERAREEQDDARREAQEQQQQQRDDRPMTPNSGDHCLSCPDR